SEQTKKTQLNQLQASEDSSRAINYLSEKLNSEERLDFVLALKNIFLMLSKGDLKNISIDSQGLEALKKMLLNAGFEENDIIDLFDKFSEELGNNTLAMDDLLDRLFDLSLEVESDTEIFDESFLETSAIPFLESILNSLGIPKEKISEILYEADRGEKGISLEVFIEKLQDLQKKSFYTGNHIETQEGDDNFSLLIKQLGFEKNESKTSALTLNEFVSSLEKLYQKISQQQAAAYSQTDIDPKFAANGKPLDLLSSLFKGLEFKNKNAETKTFEFSYEQIRDELKNQLLVPDNEKTNKNSLFSVKKENGKSVAGAKLENAFKEMESLLIGKKNGTADMADQLKDNKEFLKQVKSASAKLFDQTSMSALDTKTNDIQSGLNGLKTKSSFRNLPTYVTHQVSKSLVRAINQGESILRIQLKPPELGRLMMTIDNTGNSMKVSIMTDNIAAKEILAANVNELKTVLSNSGVNLERFEVDMSSNFNQSMADARNQAGNFGKQRRNKEKLNQTNGEGNTTPKIHLDTLNQGGALHFVA
ncbi:MAG: hypothetical protein DRH34_14910, partial [Deltaproteobacteria bacterium]